MAAEESFRKILEHLKKKGPLNTFRLARTLDLDRSRLLNFIEKLEKAGAVEVQHGLVKFLKFVVEEKKVSKPEEAKKTGSKPKKKIVNIKKRKKIQKKSTTLNVQIENKELKEKILQLESKVKELRKKAAIPPKIIQQTKTIIKKIPVPFLPPSSPPPKKKKRKIKRKKIKKKAKLKIAKKFKLPKFTFMKNIKQLKKPEFAKK